MWPVRCTKRCPELVPLRIDHLGGLKNVKLVCLTTSSAPPVFNRPPCRAAGRIEDMAACLSWAAVVRSGTKVADIACLTVRL